MLFRQHILQGIAEGRVTLAFRRWRRAPPARGSSLLGTLAVTGREGPTVADNIAADVLAADQVRKAVDLRVRGAHWNEIAQACGYPSPAAALKAVGEAMAASTQRATETADSMRDTANLRLEHLLRETLGMLAADAPMDLEGNQPDDRAVKLRAVDEAYRSAYAKLPTPRQGSLRESEAPGGSSSRSRS